MKGNYRDILSRIAEPPLWWDVHGCPRFDEPDTDLLPFIREIACQACGRVFRVALVDEVYKVLGGEPLELRVGPKCPHDPKQYHIIVENGSMSRFTKEEGFVPIPLPDWWHYGDPPAHNCVGDTMNSVPDRAWGTEEDYRPEGGGHDAL